MSEVVKLTAVKFGERTVEMHGDEACCLEIKVMTDTTEFMNKQNLERMRERADIWLDKPRCSPRLRAPSVNNNNNRNILDLERHTRSYRGETISRNKNMY